MDIYCGDTGNNVDFTIHCTVIAATNDINDIIESKFDVENNATAKFITGKLFNFLIKRKNKFSFNLKLKKKNL